ncbi:MAG: DNA-directed RNA polymerase [Candidatus Nezhaarchaeales archaeon]
MYYLVKATDIVRIPPDKFNKSLKQSALEILREKYEGTIVKDVGSVIAVIDVDVSPIGEIIHGDGATYHEATFTMLTFKPLEQEVVESEVTDVTDFGVFVRLGPLEGLIHISQIIDDYISYNPKESALLCKQTHRTLRKGDAVRSRITTISLSGSSLRQCKIGLTMRQPFLGALKWIEEDLKKRKEGK